MSLGKGNNGSASKAEKLMACFVSYGNHSICVRELLLVPCLLVRLTCLNKNNSLLRPWLSILSSVSSPLLHFIIHIGMLTMIFISSACVVLMKEFCWLCKVTLLRTQLLISCLFY